MSVELVREVRLAPGQTRIVPLRIKQTGPFNGSELIINMHWIVDKKFGDRVPRSAGGPFRLPIKQLPLWTEDSFEPIIGTYFFAGSMPTAFSAVPPKNATFDAPGPPILALRAFSSV
jgi:hypothetical protein